MVYRRDQCFGKTPENKFFLAPNGGSNFSIFNDNRKGISEKKEIKRKNGLLEVTLQPQGGLVFTN